jgi:hypothetical protein
MVTNYYRAEQTTEQGTTSTTFVDVSGTTVTFTPGDTSEAWVIFATGVLRSDSTAETAAEVQLVYGGVTQDLAGHQNNDATTPNGAGFFLFGVITSTVSLQTVKLQFRAAAGTTYLDNARVIAAKLPPNSDWQFFESDAITQTTGVDQQVGQLQFTPSSAGDYYIFGKMSHREFPGGSTSQAWLEYGSDLHPDAPVGVHHSNARDAWNPMSVAVRKTLPLSLQSFNLRFTSSSSGAGTSEHQYRRILAFRADVFEEDNYSESLSQSTSTSASFTTKNSLVVGTPPSERDYLVIQSARISGDNSTTGQKSGELRTGGTPKIRTDHHINRDGSSTQGYHHMAVYADAVSTSSSVTYDNGFLSPDAITVQCAESVIIVLRWPGAEDNNAPFFGMNF